MEQEFLPVAPYDFDLSARIFSHGDKQIRHYDGTAWRQVLRTDGRLVLATVRSEGTVDSPRLLATYFGVDLLSSEEGRGLGALIERMFNLSVDLKPFYLHVQDDSVISKLVVQLKGLKSPRTQSVYEALVDAIIEQQISLTAARAIQYRLVKSCGEVHEVDGVDYFAFPNPERVAALSIEELKGVGLSGKKAEYVRDASRMVVDESLDLRRLERMEDLDQVLEELITVRGIGRWTAEEIMIRGMGRLDALPADDLGILRIVSHHYFHDQKITAKQAREVAAGWGKWQGLAAFYLLVAESLERKSGLTH